MFAHKTSESPKRGTSVQKKRAQPSAGGPGPAQPNLLWQQLATRVQTKLSVSAPNDPYEREADQVADRVMRMTGPAVQRSCAACVAGAPPCPKCVEQEDEERPVIHRKAQDFRESDGVVPEDFLSHLGSGRPLDQTTRGFMEPRFGVDFNDVRIHTGPHAEHAATRLNARAFTRGSNIVFGRGEYQSGSTSGQLLLAHELTHVVQQSAGIVSSRAVQRQATHQSITPAYAAGLDDRTLQSEVSEVRQALLDPATPAAEHDALQENLGVLENEVRSRNTAAAVASPAGPDFDSRLAAFKQLVLTTARLRLASNRANLAIWRATVAGMPLTERTARAIQAAQIQQTVGHLAVGQWDVARCLAERNPIRREIYCGQLEGRYRACTGCHLEQHATRLDQEAGPEGRAMWSSMAERVTGIPDVSHSPFDPLASRQAPSEAQMRRLNEITATYRSIIAALGPDGYQVWPDSFVNWDSPDLEAIRAGILSRIDQRQSDYLELMRMISAGEREYLEFQPILQDLLPLADADVRQAVQDEIESRRHRGIIMGILVGIASIGLLLLTIFPPTTAIGVAGFAALEAGLGAYAFAGGVEAFDQGYAYSLATGANDVYSPEQQSSGGGMMLMGFINVVTGPLMMYTGALRGVGAAGRIAEAGPLAAFTPARALSQGSSAVFGAGEMTSLGSGTVRQGRLILSYEADGTIVGTVQGRSDLLLIARDGEAVLYLRTAEGGLTAVERAPLPAGGALPPGAPGVEYPSQWPHVPQTEVNWCGAACGEMAAGRLGGTVTQEQLAAHPLFSGAETVGHTEFPGGFQTTELRTALDDLAAVPGRRWVGGQIITETQITPGVLRQHLQGWLGSSGSSIILRVARGNHWIIVDEITADGLFAIRDPGLGTSTAVTAEELAAMAPTGDGVLSLPVRGTP